MPGFSQRIGAGFVAALTFVPSTWLLGAIFGASTGAVGISAPAAVVMSAVVWSGAGQFAALPLWSEGGGVVVLSALALSLRFTLITASMAPMLVGRPRWLRAALAFCVTDENYALAVTQQRSVLHPGYLFGSWIPLYGSWVIGTIVGVVLGAGVPAEWIGPLKAVFPLVFLVLTVLLCTSVPLALAAVSGGVMSIAFAMYLPSGWNIVSAGLLASLAGIPLERLLRVAPAGQLGALAWNQAGYLVAFVVAIRTRRMVPSLAAGLVTLVVVTLLRL